MAKPRNRFLDLLTCAVLRGIAAVVIATPLEVTYALAGLMGEAMFVLDRRHRRRAVEHLRRSYPEWDERRVRSVARGSLRALCYLGLELLLTTRLITPLRWRRHIQLANIQEALRLLVERKTGLILVTGHFGNWEVLGFTLATLGFPNTAIFRPLDNAYLNDYVTSIRERRGLRILDKKGAAANLDAMLDAKQAVSFVADQDAGRKGLFVDFFGRPASTYKSIGLMAMRHEVPIIVGYARRLGKQYRFEICIERIIHPSDWADRDDPLHWITQTYTSALEAVIRRHPKQYLWAHRRWKHRPRGENRPADGIA
jgi:Kdo2-lipid IVA lauroyltransferase/acyltransferase